MTVFFVGQRVRIVEGAKIPAGARDAIGREGRITGVSKYSQCDWEVDIGNVDYVYDCAECCLEPILGAHEPCESDFKESLDKLLSEVSDHESVK